MIGKLWTISRLPRVGDLPESAYDDPTRREKWAVFNEWLGLDRLYGEKATRDD